MQVEFTDRYGSEGPPSWLRGCHADCEAMGVVPHKPRWWIDKRPGKLTGLSILHLEPPTKSELAYDEAWRKAEAIETADDGWHFVVCPECNGTGRGIAVETLRPLIDGIPKCWRRHSTVIPLITEGKTEYKAIEFDLHNGLRGNHARYMSGAVRAKGEIEFVRVKLAP